MVEIVHQSSSATRRTPCWTWTGRQKCKCWLFSIQLCFVTAYIVEFGFFLFTELSKKKHYELVKNCLHKKNIIHSCVLWPCLLFRYKIASLLQQYNWKPPSQRCILQSLLQSLLDGDNTRLFALSWKAILTNEVHFSRSNKKNNVVFLFSRSLKLGLWTRR